MFKIIKIFSTLILFIQFNAISQLIVNEDGFALKVGENYFNADSIRLHKIKSMRGELYVKLPLQPLKKDSLVFQHYDFDTLGRLEKMYYTRKLYYNDDYFPHFDTIVFFWQYEPNKIIKRETHQYNTYKKIINKLDDENRLIEKTTCLEKNIAPIKTEFYANDVKILSSEYYNYKSLDDTISVVEVFLDSEDYLYKRTQNYYGKSKKIERSKDKIVNSPVESTTAFTYDEKNNIISIEQKEYENQDVKKIVFSYDNLNRVTRREEFINSKSKRNHEVFYQKNGLIRAFIIQNDYTADIEIIKFKYTYYNSP